MGILQQAASSIKYHHEQDQASICAVQPRPEPRPSAVSSHNARHTTRLALEPMLDDGFGLPVRDEVDCQKNFEEAFMNCTQSGMDVPDSTGQDEAFLLGNFQDLGSGCSSGTTQPILAGRPELINSIKIDNPVLETAANGLVVGISPYNCLLRGSVTSVQPRNVMFTQGCTFMSTKKLLQTAKGAKVPTQFPMIQLYARVVYSSRENFLRQQYFQLSDLTEPGGVLTASLSRWEAGGLLDIKAAELLGESPNGLKCFIRGRLVQNAQSACGLGLVMDIQDIRYAGWAEIRLMNDTLDIGDPMIPSLF